MLAALTTIYLGLELYKWIIIAIAVGFIVAGIIKKLTKLVIFVGALAAIYLVCSQFGILPL